MNATQTRRELVRQLVAYGVVGVLGTALDVAFFWIFLRLGLPVSLAVTAAFFGATAVQFVFNRQWSFRAFHRPATAQAPVYAFVTLINWLLALALVEAGVAFFRLSPLEAKVMSIPPTALLGFIANRYLTFGVGVRATLERMRLPVREQRKK